LMPQQQQEATKNKKRAAEQRKKKPQTRRKRQIFQIFQNIGVCQFFCWHEHFDEHNNHDNKVDID